MLPGVALCNVLHIVHASDKVIVTEWALQPNGYPIEREPPKPAPSNQFTFLCIFGSLFFAAASSIEDMLPKMDRSDRAVMALGMTLSTAPLAFVTIAAAKRQGMSAEHRRLLGWMFVASLMAGALLGYPVLQHRPLELRMVLVALASGFLITTVVQGIIPEANREGEPGFAGVLYIGGLSLYALMSLALK